MKIVISRDVTAKGDALRELIDLLMQMSEPNLAVGVRSADGVWTLFQPQFADTSDNGATLVTGTGLHAALMGAVVNLTIPSHGNSQLKTLTESPHE